MAAAFDKQQIRVADMNRDMIAEAIDTARKAIEKYEIERDIAKYIKEHFDTHHYPYWHCIVGKYFGSIATYESRHYINFMVGDLSILLYKFG